MTIPVFSGSDNSMALSERFHRLDVETGNEKLNMAAAKPDVPVCQLICMIA
jgi:hypothetical protein